MTDKDCSTGACPVDKKDGKLVRSTDLPLLGNPHPPTDVIENNTPGFLEQSIASIRTTIQPYMAPLCSVYRKTNDVISIGVAHSQGAIENLRENQSSFTNVIVITGSALLGFTIARKRGFFKKIIYPSLLGGGATAFCYPKEVQEKADIILLMAKSRLSSTIAQNYNLIKQSSEAQDSEQTDATSSNKTSS